MKVKEAKEKGLLKPLDLPKIGEITEIISNSNIFSDKLKSIMNMQKISYKKMGEVLGVTEGAVSNWANGNRFPQNQSQIADIADILKIPISDLFPNAVKQREMIVKDELTHNMAKYNEFMPSGKMPSNIVKVSLVNGYVGAGSSGIVESEDVYDEIYVDIHTITQKYRSKQIKGINIIGDSMTPYVNGGDIVLYTLIDDNFQKLDGKYIVKVQDSLQLKNIQFRLNGDIVISSENKIYDSETISKDSQELFEVVGVVVGRVLKS